MKTLHSQLVETLSQIVAEITSESVTITVEAPARTDFGDYTSNIAMVLAKKVGQNPMVVAEDIAARLRRAASTILATESGVTVANPGFINITLDTTIRARELADTDFKNFSTGILAGQTVLVEHSSPNLFKPFHIGHFMNNAVGESETRLMRATGATVFTTSFPSDISLGIAKAVYAICNVDDFKKRDQELSDALLSLEKKDSVNIQLKLENSIDALLRDGALFGGEAYVKGTELYESSENIKVEVKAIADTLYSYIENNDQNFTEQQSQWIEIYKKYSTKSRDYLFAMLKAFLGSTFDSFIFESEAGIRGAEIIRAHTPSVFTQSEGAIVYIPAEERKDINTAVFINSQGNPTYEAKDVGLIDLKFERYNPDVSLFVTDTEQTAHFRVVLAAYDHINHDRVERSHHITHGRMQFKGKKISSRLGGVPTAEEVLVAVREEVVERLRDEQKSDEQLISDIAIGALKFAILRVKAGQGINFDPDTSLSFEGDSGPYLMYTHARIYSLVSKAVDAGIVATDMVPTDWNPTEVEKVLLHWSQTIERAQREYAPHLLVTYLLQLAQTFNSWYGSTKMVDTDNAAGYRIHLCQKVADAINRGLWILGINAPEKM